MLSSRFSRLLTKKIQQRNNLALFSTSSFQLPEYNHLKVEKKWQDYWEKNKTFQVTRDRSKPKKYILDMFPYPSGSGLHVGHPEGYTATDIMSRYYRSNNYDVLHPMGWDAFGLPAEQHAINTGTHPRETTYKNIDNFRRQLKSLGFSYDWSRELSTTDEDYLKWTQWIFLQLYKAGLATQSEVMVNWCPALGTVLANEEIINGKSERGDHPVERQPLRQWVFEITKYADKLIDGLSTLEWPEGTIHSQKQWIGKNEGVNIIFKKSDDDSVPLEIFTTRPDTLFGVTYLTIAPEHPLLEKFTTNDNKENVKNYLEKVRNKSDLERNLFNDKTGVFLGSYVIHPFTQEKIPVWTSDYVLSHYGTGAVMGVPAHDERDYLFAKKFGLPVKQVIFPPNENLENKLPYITEGIVKNSHKLIDNVQSDKSRTIIINALEQMNIGTKKITYKLRDWIFSRQRYWGEPIPIYFPVELKDKNSSPLTSDDYIINYDKPIPVKEEDLPLRLPDMNDFHPGNDPQGCLARQKEWRFFQQKDENNELKWYARETNTMPQWAGSCWYYLRFADNKNSKEFVSLEAQDDWLPVDLYVGGQEHAVLHLLYARFWHKVLYDLNLVKHSEPFMKLIHQGMILGADGEKMSKSKGNIINPDDIINEYGADVLRLYEMFMGPLEAMKPWQTSQLKGVVRFREKVYSLLKSTIVNESDVSNSKDYKELLRQQHFTIKKCTEDIEKFSFNTAISQLMIFTNNIYDYLKKNNNKLPLDSYKTLLLLLNPIAPHISEECWSLLNEKLDNEVNINIIANEPWPKHNEQYLVESTTKIAIQLNGKVRDVLNDVEVSLSEQDIIAMALNSSKLKNFINNNVKNFESLYLSNDSTKEIDVNKIKVRYVPGKIVIINI